MSLTAPGLLSRNPWVPRWALSVAEYHRMGEAGILTEDDRVELIEGELIAMTPIGSGHSGAVIAMTHLLVEAVGGRAFVSTQNPIRLDDHSEPQPDFAVLKPRADRYRSATPQPEDVVLLVEIADSSLAYDRAVKRPLYARHRIPELWIVDLAAGEVEVCRAPGKEDYGEVVRVGRDGMLGIAALPGVTIPAAAVLG